MIRTKESTTKLSDLITAGRARILKVTISTHAGRWFASFACVVAQSVRTPGMPEATVGVDAGITRLATASMYGHLVAEKLNVAGMTRNRRLARAVAACRPRSANYVRHRRPETGSVVLLDVCRGRGRDGQRLRAVNLVTRAGLSLVQVDVGTGGPRWSFGASV